MCSERLFGRERRAVRTVDRVRRTVRRMWLRRGRRSEAPSEEVKAPDERFTLVLDQAFRALKQQQDALDSLRDRAGTLVAAAALVSSFLGAATLAAKHPACPAVVLTVLALAAFLAVVIAVVIILWPYSWAWGIDAHRLLADYVEASPPASLDVTRRSLAYHIANDVKKNQVQLDKLTTTLRVAVIAIGAEVTLWTIALTVR